LGENTGDRSQGKGDQNTINTPTEIVRKMFSLEINFLTKRQKKNGEKN